MLPSDPPNRSRSPHSTGTIPSPLSNGAGSSLSDSPSPPRSSASPPDALQQLSLAGSSRGRKDGKQERTVPCAQCRKIRRVCRWLQDRECERCRKLGLTCSGPQRRGRAALDDFLEEVDSVERDDVVLSPSSPATTWARRSFSYSLTQHLVETCMQFAQSMPFGGINLSDFIQGVYASAGKTSELSSDHEAILGTTTPAPHLSLTTSPTDIHSLDTPAIGSLRQSPLSTVAQLIIERVERFDFRQAYLQTAVDRLYLSWIALEPLYGTGVEEERHAVLGELVRIGVELLDHNECEGEVGGQLLFILQGLIGGSPILRHLRPSEHTPTVHALIFSSEAEGLEMPVMPDDVFETFFFDANPVARSAPLPEFEAICDAGEIFVYQLDCLLVYAPSDYLVRAVERCWIVHDRFTTYVDEQVSRLVDDPRFAQLAPAVQARRPVALVTNLCSIRLAALQTLHATRRILLSLGGHEILVAESKSRISAELSALAKLSKLVLDLYSEQPMGTYFAAFRLTIGLESFQPAFLSQWASKCPEERELLLSNLRLAAFYLPVAARLVNALEGQAESSPIHASITSLPTSPEQGSSSSTGSSGSNSPR
ncbi:hypothetical protein JCM8547_006061 [Rhodosporidiobolus lusitaniae]